jgi:hypothetical protein
MDMNNISLNGLAETRKCRGCGETLTADNDSEAHVFPNALGGRLKPKGIICRTCNTELDALADNALITAFGDWPTLLDIPRDRGSNPPKQISTNKGERVRLQADGFMTAVDVKYDVSEIEAGHKVEIAAGDKKTFRQLLKRAEKEFPQFDAKLAERNAQRVALDSDSLLKINLDYSPPAVFGGVITAIWLYLILTTGRTFVAWEHLHNVIRSMQANGGSFRYLIGGLPGLSGPDVRLGHKIVVRSVPQTGKLIAYVEILGMLKIGGVFADAGGPVELVEHVYVYDVIGKADRSSEFQIDSRQFEKQDWSSVGLGPEDVQALADHFRKALESNFVRHYSERFSTPPVEPT